MICTIRAHHQQQKSRGARKRLIPRGEILALQEAQAQKDAEGVNWQIGRDDASDQCHYPGIIKAAHVGRSAAAEGEIKASAWTHTPPLA